ncbi:MAG: 5-formyltetrahydrofolate cyclo-ligase [Leptospiraceae bacterium]|nr:5-formyltetrahydrofolate cyclo-ligase [Leptospiraceae bacterium]
MTKQEARVYSKELIKTLANRQKKEDKVLRLLNPILDPFEKIFAYKADFLEINLDPIFHHFSNKKFYFPAITSLEKKEMVFRSPDSWKKGEFGILEPIGEETSPTHADIILVPALGYNSFGYRLGRGAGFYDRALLNISKDKMIGLCFSELSQIDFTQNEFDIGVGKILTEKAVIFP